MTNERDGRAAAEDLTNRTFGRLIAKEQVERPKGLSEKRRGAWWLCECECGGKKIASAYNLKQGNIKSCGCMAKDRAAKAKAGKARAAQLKDKNVTNFKTTGGDNTIKSFGGLTVQCMCYTCKEMFEKLSSGWAYKAVIAGRLQFFCSWHCYRKATTKPKKAHGNSLAARASEG